MNALPAALALVRLAGAVEADVATTPYAALHAVLAPVADIARYPHLAAIERIESKVGDVAPGTIRVVVHAKSGDIAVPVAADGVVEFPVSTALVEENPSVGTNQPKGSLALTVSVAIRTGDRLRVPWHDIETALGEVKAFFAKSRGVPAPAIDGIEVRFAPGEAAMLTIEGRSERLLMADASGRIVVLRDTADGDAPTLVFSRVPRAVTPYTEGKK
jgi:hypothetical protein